MRILLGVVLLLGLVLPAQAREAILDFHSDITVNDDGHLSITETITVQAEGAEIRRGIYRDFPTMYRNMLGFRTMVPFTVIRVTRDGRDEPYHLQAKENGQRVYIGDANIQLDPGQYTYTLTYTTDRQLGYFTDHDELYWNVTGNDWSFPILKASAIVYVPGGARATAFNGYTGPQDATLTDYTAQVLVSGAVRFDTTQPLSPREGLTVVVEWPKGFVAEPTPAQNYWRLWSDNRDLVVAGAGLIIVLIFYGVAWHKVGRDPMGGVIVPHYEPPEKLSPGAVRYIRRMGYDDKTLASALVNMAVNGAIEIAEHGDDYTLKKRDDFSGQLTPAESALRSALFAASSTLELKQKNHRTLKAARKAHEGALRKQYEKVYFRANREWFIPGGVISVASIVAALALIPGEMRFVGLFLLAWLTGWSFGVHALARGAIMAWRKARSVASYIAAFAASLFAIPFLLGEAFGLTMFAAATSVGFIFVLMATAATHFVFLNLMKAPTLAGRKVMDRVEGFRLYLSVAEGDELKRSDLPQEDIKVFERFFPFALALDVEQEWSDRFAETFANLEHQGTHYRPGWYRASRGSSSFSSGFSSGLGGALTGAVAAASTAPGRSSGGGSGGSSGGGGGGGGGGGW